MLFKNTKNNFFFIVYLSFDVSSEQYKVTLTIFFCKLKKQFQSYDVYTP